MTSPLQTPEALLGRNDSKNPTTTCKGITSSGRPCRRPLAASIGRRRSSAGVVAVIEEDGTISDADFYCWQHKDQAEARIQQEQNASRRARKKRSAELYPLQERSSIDTLVQRLGINAAEEEKRTSRKTGPNGGVRPPERTQTTDFAKVSNSQQLDDSYAEQYNTQARPQRKPSSKKQQPGFCAALCCTNSHDDDYIEVVRHRKRTQYAHQNGQEASMSAPTVGYPQGGKPLTAQVPPRRPMSSNSTVMPIRQQQVASNPHTGHLLSFIPERCSPTTTSALLAELVKPISSADEDGYIYIFWLTPQDKKAPEESAARSLLSSAGERSHRARRISDVMTEFSYEGSHDHRGSNKNTIMLKIGRANNVTRRMKEWQRQCGYKLNLVRWYPYVSSSGTPSPVPSPSRSPAYPDLSRPPDARRQSDIVRKVPYVKRVERLIHLELAEQRVLRDCKACGKEHREWFEVDASQEGVRAVDDCVRRWVAWAEQQVSGGVGTP